MIASNSASSSANDVRMRQWISACCDRISRHISTPLPSGSRTSSTATSGRVAEIRASASSAVPASPTTSMSPLCRGARGHLAGRPRGRRAGTRGWSSSILAARGGRGRRPVNRAIIVPLGVRIGRAPSAAPATSAGGSVVSRSSASGHGANRRATAAAIAASASEASLCPPARCRARSIATSTGASHRSATRSLALWSATPAAISRQRCSPSHASRTTEVPFSRASSRARSQTRRTSAPSSPRRRSLRRRTRRRRS